MNKNNTAKTEFAQPEGVITWVEIGNDHHRVELIDDEITQTFAIVQNEIASNWFDVIIDGKNVNTGSLWEMREWVEENV